MPDFPFDPGWTGVLLVIVGVLVSQVIWSLFGGTEQELTQELGHRQPDHLADADEMKPEKHQIPAQVLRPMPGKTDDDPAEKRLDSRITDASQIAQAASHALKQERDNRARLESISRDQESQLEGLDQEIRNLKAVAKHCETLKNALHASESQVAELEQQRLETREAVQKFERRATELETQLTAERNTIQDLERKQQDNSQEWAEERRKLSLLRGEIQSRDETIAELRQSTESLRAEQADLREALEQHNTQLSFTDQQRVSLEERAAKAQQHIESLEENLREQQAQFHQLEQERTLSLEEHEGERQRIQQLTKELELLRARFGQQLEETRSAQQTVEQHLAQRTDELERERQVVHRFEEQLKDSEDTTFRLKRRLEQYESQLLELQQAKQRDLDNWQQDRRSLQALEEENRRHQDQLESMEQRESEARQIESNLHGLQQSLDQQQAKLECLRQDREDALATVTRHELKVVHLDGELQRHVHELQELREQQAEVEQQKAAEQARAEALQVHIQRVEQAFDEERERRTVAESSLRRVEQLLQIRHDEVQSLRLDLREVHDHRSELERQLDAAEQKLSGHSGESDERVRFLEQTLQAQQDRLQAAESERDCIAQELQTIQTRRKRLSEALRQAEANDQQILRHDPVLGDVFLRQPRYHDDLKHIAGLDEDVERRLNELGVYRFAQIMAWNEVAIEMFAKLLSLQGQITEHDWVGQALRLNHDAERSAA